VSFTNAKANATTYTYDSLNRRIKVTDPLGLFSSFSYDAVGNPISVTDANGKISAFSYDAVNRLVTRTYADGNVIGYSYDVNGNRSSMTDADGVTTYSHDALNRITAVSSPGGSTVKYGYDGVGHRISLTYPDGRIVTYAYDAASRLSQVTDWLSRKTAYTYDSAGNRIGVTMGNGANSSFGYDNANRLSTIVNRSGNKVQTAFTYSLDAAGNRTQVTDGAGGLTRYGYDALNRLTSWIAPSGQVTSYAYDAAGNRTSMTSSAGTTAYAYDVDDRMLSAGTSSYTYDGNGNRLTKTTGTTEVSYAFDALNRLIAASGGGIAAQYRYDGDGNRVSQQAGAASYQYAVDVARRNPSILNENGPDGNIDFQYGLTMLSGSSSTLEQFYQADGVGSTADVTDATDTLKASYAYDPWGKLLNPIDPLGTKDKFKFTGEALDAQTGLYYFRARYYDPTIGRFISKDRFGGVASMPSTVNRYTYVLNNPLGYTDRSGSAPEPSGDQDIGVHSGALFGGLGINFDIGISTAPLTSSLDNQGQSVSTNTASGTDVLGAINTINTARGVGSALGEGNVLGAGAALGGIDSFGGILLGNILDPPELDDGLFPAPVPAPSVPWWATGIDVTSPITPGMIGASPSGWGDLGSPGDGSSDFNVGISDFTASGF
jgi:RHS repeat-associated protein